MIHIENRDMPRLTRDYFNAVGRRYFELFRDELEQKPYDQAILDRFARELGVGARVCDAGCGPCGHVARRLSDQGLSVIGVDLSEHCIELARQAEPEIDFRVMDMAHTDFEAESLDGIVAYYSILYTPKALLPDLLDEFHRVLKPKGKVLIVVKEGQDEGVIEDPMGTEHLTYFANFTEVELRGILEQSRFVCRFAEARDPYDFELPVRRIYLLAEKGNP